MVTHEIIGIFTLALTGAIFLAALTNPNTGSAISSSLQGFGGLISAVTGSAYQGKAAG